MYNYELWIYLKMSNTLDTFKFLGTMFIKVSKWDHVRKTIKSGIMLHLKKNEKIQNGEKKRKKKNELLINSHFFSYKNINLRLPQIYKNFCHMFAIWSECSTQSWLETARNRNFRVLRLTISQENQDNIISLNLFGNVIGC